MEYLQEITLIVTTIEGLIKVVLPFLKKA